MASADILSWHPEDDDPGYCNRECQIKQIRFNTLKFSSDIYPVSAAKEPVFTDDDFDVPDHDMLTSVNHLDTGTLYNYWSCDTDVITLNAIQIDKDDPTALRGQFDSDADVTVTNLFIYLHDYKQYSTKLKCPVKLTGTVGTNDIHPLGEGFLYLPVPTPSEFLAVCCFYSTHLSCILVSPCDILKTSKD